MKWNVRGACPHGKWAIVTEHENNMAFEGLHCPKCGYPLTGLSLPRCPECGELFNHRELHAIGNKPRHVARHLFSGILAMIAGPLAVCIPAWINSVPIRGGTVFPALAAGIEHMSRATFLSMLLASVAVGLLGSMPAVVLAFLMALAFPVATFVDGAAYPQSHNLWPLEMVFYAAFFPVFLIGTCVGRLLRWGMDKCIEVSRL